MLFATLAIHTKCLKQYKLQFHTYAVISTFSENPIRMDLSYKLCVKEDFLYFLDNWFLDNYPGAVFLTYSIEMLTLRRNGCYH